MATAEAQRFADAIRRGAKFGEQRFYEYLDMATVPLEEWDGKIHSCALGAALLGTRGFDVGRDKEGVWGRAQYLTLYEPLCGLLHEQFGEVLGEVAVGGCPVAGCLMLRPPGLKLVDVIVHLNDVHKWTRERIADWIEGGAW